MKYNLTEKLTQQAMQTIWYPASQMKDYQNFRPLHIKRAWGSYFELACGKKIIDGISSWWCKSLGHNYPRLQQALIAQMENFEHVIMANTVSDALTELSPKLTSLLPGLGKVMYASDGSSAVEIALKMSIHAQQLQGNTRKTKFIYLQNGYHGETIGAMSVSDVGLYKKPYHSLLNQNNIIVTGLPYVNTIADPLWHNAEQNWRKIEALLLANEKEISALIVEPIVQGAGGMLIYSQDLLKRIRRFTKEHNIHLIADEIMTGFGRTGKMLACEHAGIQPDFLCLGKALTAGWLPLSAVVTTDQIYNFFYDDYELGKSFLHSHTHAGNVLAAAVALETLKIFEAEDICEKGKIMGNYMLNAMQEIAEETQLLANVRGIGALAAADIRGARQEQRLGYQVCLRACELGAYLRPLGNTIYWLPPLNTPLAVIDQLKSITRQALLEVLRHSL